MLIKLLLMVMWFSPMTDQLFIYDVPQALKANAFTKTDIHLLVGQLHLQEIKNIITNNKSLT